MVLKEKDIKRQTERYGKRQRKKTKREIENDRIETKTEKRKNGLKT